MDLQWWFFIGSQDALIKNLSCTKYRDVIRAMASLLRRQHRLAVSIERRSQLRNSGNVVDPSDSVNFTAFVKNLRGMFNQQGWTQYAIALRCTYAPEQIKFDVENFDPSPK
jgi:hypothetical protein